MPQHESKRFRGCNRYGRPVVCPDKYCTTSSDDETERRRRKITSNLVDVKSVVDGIKKKHAIPSSTNKDSSHGSINPETSTTDLLNLDAAPPSISEAINILNENCHDNENMNSNYIDHESFCNVSDESRSSIISPVLPVVTNVEKVSLNLPYFANGSERSGSLIPVENGSLDICKFKTELLQSMMEIIVPHIDKKFNEMGEMIKRQFANLKDDITQSIRPKALYSCNDSGKYQMKTMEAFELFENDEDTQGRFQSFLEGIGGVEPQPTLNRFMFEALHPKFAREFNYLRNPAKGPKKKLLIQTKLADVILNAFTSLNFPVADKVTFETYMVNALKACKQRYSDAVRRGNVRAMDDDI